MIVENNQHSAKDILGNRTNSNDCNLLCLGANNPRVAPGISYLGTSNANKRNLLCFGVQTIQGLLGGLPIWVPRMLKTRSSRRLVTCQSPFIILQVPYPEVNTRIPMIKPRHWFLCVSPSDSVRVGSQPLMTVGMPIALWMPSDFLSAPFRPQESLGLHRFAG